MSVILPMTPHEVRMHIARRAREKRLSFNWSQQTLSQRSGVSFGVIKKFEHTGKISLESLLKIAFSLDSLGEFQNMFKPKRPEEFKTLDELLSQKIRVRGRQ